jgi:hypothetical protein
MSSDPKKFLFDQNIFKEDEGIPLPEMPVQGHKNLESAVEKEPEPLPPMFTEEEVERARRESFDKGRQEGIAQTKAERDENVTKILQQVSEQIAAFEEHKREAFRAQHADALRLAMAMFEKTLPVLQDRFGLDNLKAQVETILRAHSGQNTVDIHIHPDMVETFGTYIAQMEKDSATVSCVLTPDESLSLYACTVKWKNGGGYTDQNTIAQHVCDKITGILSDKEVPTQTDTRQKDDEKERNDAHNDQNGEDK